MDSVTYDFRADDMRQDPSLSGSRPSFGRTNSCALLFQIDRIDLIIAACGEVAGREVREAVRDALKAALEERWAADVSVEQDRCGRILLTVSGLDERELEVLAAELCERVAGVAIRRSWGEVFVTLSVGGAVSEVVPVNRKVLRLWSASALEDGRRRGSRLIRIVKVPSSLADWYRGAMAVLSEVRGAVDSGRVELAFQPVINADGGVFYYEGLIRLTDEQGAKLLPGEFIPSLEQLGMMGWLDQLVFEKVVAELRVDDSVVLGCNVSGQSICDRRWMQQILRIFRDEPHLARRMVIEITETAAIFDMVKAVDHIMALRKLGCRVALDDFGAGFASFAHLAGLGVDIVKIDQGFLSADRSDGDWLQKISHLAGLAGGLGMHVVVEGVENDYQLEVLQIPSVSHVQGYRFGYPSAYRRWRQARGPLFADAEVLPSLSTRGGAE